AILNRVLGRRRLDRRNVGLVLPDHAFELHLPAARAPQRARNVNCLMNAIRLRSTRDSPVFSAALPAWLLRIRFRTVSRERTRLSLPCSPRFIERLAQSRILGSQDGVLLL